MRRKSIPVAIGHIQIGGDAPVVVQSMTDTDTANREAIIAQAKALADVGSELVQLIVNSAEAAAEVTAIRAELDESGYRLPLIGDFHYMQAVPI